MSDRIDLRRGDFATDLAFKRAVELESRGKLAEAEKIYRTILERHPNHFRTLHNLAGVLIGASRHEEAARVARKALNQAPNSAEAHAKLASVLLQLDRYDEALERAGRALALNAQLPAAHAVQAEVLSALGRYDEAISAQARAIEIAPDEPALYYNWGEMKRWTADDPRLAALEVLAQRSKSLPMDDQINVHFALAKAYAHCGDIDRAFHRQVEGAALKRRTLEYNEALPKLRLQELRHEVDADWMRRHQSGGDPSLLPVFIVGMPRSGSTLVEQILGSHPRIRTLGEKAYFTRALAGICGAPTIPASLAQIAAKWSDHDLRRLGGLYLDAVRRDVPGTPARITDKLLENFRFVGIIHAALPNARIINTCRDPIDTCLSIFSILFIGDRQPYSYDLGELGRHYRSYEKMMAHWRSVLPAGVMIDVKYEDVVDDLEGQARRIIAHCGLEWDDACLEFHKNDRPVRTASHAQVRQPIYRSSVGKPRPPRELMLPLLEALGLD